MRWSASILKKIVMGAFLATLILATQEGGKPLIEAAWILIGAALATVVDAYANHLSMQSYGDLRAYARSFWESLVEDSPRTLATVPTVLFLCLAWIFHWRHDQRNPDGSVVVGYETVAMNANVALIFLLAILTARTSGSSLRGTALFGLMNAGLGWLIITVEIATS